MKNKGLFSSLFIDELKEEVALNDAAQGRMATLTQAWQNRNIQNTETFWESFLKQALGYLEFVPPGHPDAPGVYPLYENWNFNECISILYLAPPGSDIDNTAVGSFYPAKLLAHLKKRKLNWGILTDGALWRLYSTKSSRPYEDYVELPLAVTLESTDESEYGLFERFFHKASFITHPTTTTPEVKRAESEDTEEIQYGESPSVEKCPLDQDREQSEKVLEQYVKEPFLAQVDEVLQYICNGFIFDTQKSGEEYTEEEWAEIFESAVKLIYRCLFLFYAEARRLLPTDPDKADLYRRHSIQALCLEARKFRWGKRQDLDQYDLWKHLKGLINAVNDGDPEYGIMGYNGGLFDDEEERFLGKHQLRNDFLSRALYLLAFVEPYSNEPDEEYPIPYEDLEVRHLGELYENILEFTVQLADADRIRRRTKKGTEILLASQTMKKAGDTLIKKGEVYFGESALERKQTGSFYTAESLVRFLNEKSIIQPLRETFERQYRRRFNDLLEQAIKGHDAGTRRGAAQSAAVLIERFAEEEILNFKVCDPAMGSGHFLVDASNQMAGLVISLLEEVPYVEGLTVSVTSHPNNWRRRITRHCIYGIDLNPLAVNLAKLSLWLNCFASEHKLTFLDHHLRCGNSLIGIRSLKQFVTIPERRQNRKNNSNQKLLFDYSDLSSVLADAAKGVASITTIDEDDTDSQRAILNEARQATSDVSYLADLYTAYLIDSNITVGIYKELFERLAKGKSSIDSLNTTLMGILESVGDYQDCHNFFHWPLEFPEVFGADRTGGFSATVGNPPWDVLQPNTQEFYINYDPDFRRYNKQKALDVIKQLRTVQPNIAEKWEEYEAGFQEASIYYKEPAAYTCLQKGKIDLYRAFLERFFTLLKDGGRMGIVVPSGIYTDESCQFLRQQFFGQSKIDFLYCFENRWPTVFSAVDGRFKFVVFGTQKGGETDHFKCAFMEHNPERLPIIDANALKISVEHVKKFSPDTLSVMEFKRQRDIDVASKIYGNIPKLLEKKSDTWNVKFTMGDFNLSSDSKILERIDEIKQDPHLSIKNLIDLCSASDRHLVYEGKNCWFYDSAVSHPQLSVKPEHCKDINFTLPRIGFRRIAASTNERTLVPCIIPGGTLCTYGIIFADDNQSLVLSIPERIAFHSILASFLMDYLIRFQVTTSVSNRNGYTLPIIRLSDKRFNDNIWISAIVGRAARLICSDESFKDIWEMVFSNIWQSSTFWYPTSAPIDTYGPAHEKEIRRRLRDESKRLTPEWGPHCGVHDRLPDRRDTGNRAQLRAEIDAYVVHLYGLSRDDFAYILDTFPVLRRKEEKAFGEFMSKRKCLEEYDRLTLVLGEKK